MTASTPPPPFGHLPAPPTLHETPREPTSGLARWIVRPPGLAFHLAVAACALGLLWVDSSPAGDLVAFAGIALVLLVLAGTWLARLVGWFGERRSQRGGWRFAIAPLLGVAVVAGLATDIPDELRWARARPAFDQALEGAPAPTDPTTIEDFDVPSTIGGYPVSRAFRQGSAVLFQLDGGLNPSGFAYLPEGAFDELSWNGRWETFTATPLGDGWYEFSAAF